MKKVLITGANSYVGTSFDKYARERYSDAMVIDTVDMIDGSWRKRDFSIYNTIFHVAGIAHADLGNADEYTKQKYYTINTDLAIETAKKAKKSGVGQFVFMSSSIIYGDSAPYGKQKIIKGDTMPSPANFYGDSKWKADKGIQKLADDSFLVTILRPPMVYGRGSKGNYITLAKIAKKLPFFPDIQNERSILFIDNLCELVCQVIIRRKGGIFFPQNEIHTSTTELVRMIAEVSGHKIRISRIWNWMVYLSLHTPGKISQIANKAFGNLTYDQSISKYEFEYRVADLRTSIERTEGK